MVESLSRKTEFVPSLHNVWPFLAEGALSGGSSQSGTPIECATFESKLSLSPLPITSVPRGAPSRLLVRMGSYARRKRRQFISTKPLNGAFSLKAELER